MAFAIETSKWRQGEGNEVSDTNRNMSKSKGWTLQSSLLTLRMDENSNQQSTKNC